MTTEQEREHVEARWEHVTTWIRDLDSYGAGADQFNIAIFISERDAEFRNKPFQLWQEDNNEEGVSKAIHNAYEFTIERERQIAEVRREIQTLAILRGFVISGTKEWGDLMRVHVAEQVRLAKLKRGMKGVTQI